MTYRILVGGFDKDNDTFRGMALTMNKHISATARSCTITNCGGCKSLGKVTAPRPH